MGDVDVRVRSPTATAWSVTVASMILFGELFSEIQRPGVATFFGVPFADEELWPVAVGLGLLLLGSLGWLVSLYLAPGAIAIRGAPPELIRTVRPFFRPRRRGAPLSSCGCTFTFFTEKDEALGRFKKVALQVPDAPREVLLYGDFRQAARVWEALRPWKEHFATFEVHIEQRRTDYPGRTT